MGYLRVKQDSGVSHLVTQMFFDNARFYRYMTRIRKEGIDLPVSAGVMPIVRKSQITRTIALSSATVPPTSRPFWTGGRTTRTGCTRRASTTPWASSGT